MLGPTKNEARSEPTHIFIEIRQTDGLTATRLYDWPDDQSQAETFWGTVESSPVTAWARMILQKRRNSETDIVTELVQKEYIKP